MPIVIITDSATIGTAEYSLPADTSTGVPTAQTDDCVLQAFIDFANMTAAESYDVKIYEKINAGTARVVYHASLVGVQANPFVSPALILGEGWDVTVDKIAGTDRSIAWSLRKVT